MLLGLIKQNHCLDPTQVKQYAWGKNKEGKKNREKIKTYSVFAPIDRSCIILVRICEIRV